MEARDLGNTVTLYLPQAGGGAEPYGVLQDRTHVGSFATREQSLHFARTLAESIQRGRKVPVRMRIEDAAGAWETVYIDDPALSAP